MRWGSAGALTCALVLCLPLSAAQERGATDPELIASVPVRASVTQVLTPTAQAHKRSISSRASVTQVLAPTAQEHSPAAQVHTPSTSAHTSVPTAAARAFTVADQVPIAAEQAPTSGISARPPAVSVQVLGAPTTGVPVATSSGDDSRPAFLGWEAGRLDYDYGAAEVAAFVNTPEQVQLQVVLCSINEATPFRMSVILPHTSANSGIIPVKLHVDGTVTHVYAELVGNALEFQIDSTFLITLADSPTFELEFSQDDAAFLKVPHLISFPMERSRLVLSEVARSCKVLSAQHGFDSSPQLLAGILWPRRGFNSAATLKRLVQEDPERAQQLIASEHQALLETKPQPTVPANSDSPQEQARQSFNQRITHINGVPYLEPIDVDHACLRPVDVSNELLTHAPERFQLPEEQIGAAAKVISARRAQMGPAATGQVERDIVQVGHDTAPAAGREVMAGREVAAGRAAGREVAPTGRTQALPASALQEGAPTRHFIQSRWERHVVPAAQDKVKPRAYSFVLNQQCRLALDQIYARTGQEALSYLRELFYAPTSSYQHYAEHWRSVLLDSASMDFESPRATAERIEREGKLMRDYDYYLALYTLFSSGPEHLVQYPQSYYDIIHLGEDPSTFLYAMDNRYELETIKYASVLVRRLTGFITTRRNVEEALTAWWTFYQDLSTLLPPIVRAQSLRPVLYRQMLMRLWRQAGYPEALHLRPEYAFVQGRYGRISSGESLEAQCSIFEGSNNDQFFYSSPECHSIVVTDMRLLGYNNEDLRMVWRNWRAYREAWQRSPFAHNLDSTADNLQSNFDLTLLSLYKTYGFGDYYLMRKCISSRDSDICTYERFRNKESYENDVHRGIAALAKVSARDARSLGELHNLWQNYYESLCVFTNNLVTRGMLSPWRAPFIQGVAVTTQAEVILNGLNPAISSDEF